MTTTNFDMWANRKRMFSNVEKYARIGVNAKVSESLSLLKEKQLRIDLTADFERLLNSSGIHDRKNQFSEMLSTIETWEMKQVGEDPAERSLLYIIRTALDLECDLEDIYNILSQTPEDNEVL